LAAAATPITLSRLITRSAMITVLIAEISRSLAAISGHRLRPRRRA
jgi:hypothetical protein